ncbi:PH domain-containing protein [Saccharothrix sp. BKS2]|uniref:PH domain-containing protein n=1 Tax=Saccharothrix sp. BKS2 TaxID=3064400 RepID=UPI0039EB9B6C
MPKVVFRVPTPALLAAGLALICVTPVAWAAPGLQVIYLLPLGFALWVVRNRTAVDGERIVARSTFGRRVLPWADVKAIKVDPKGWLSAVLADDTLVRLPAVRTGHLPALAAVSGGRVADPTAAVAAPGDAVPDQGDAAPDAAPDQEATPPPVKSGE